MPQQRLLDFRSDTVTRPSAGMRQAMASAEVGDDVYGEDPTVRRLEERCAELLGLQGGLFVSSGTQGNQLAIGLACRPGDEVIADAGSHCLNFEGGALSALWGAQPRGLTGERGILTADQVERAVRPRNDHHPRSRLLALENTHGRYAGSVWPLGRFQEVVQRARALGLSVHLDGARLFNAQVASGVSVKEFARLTDTTSLCLSKGMGAPVGSVLCGSAEAISEARRLRKRLGGGMRQVGILAAAGLYALDHNIAKLAEDHAHARRLTESLQQRGLLQAPVFPVETNMLFADFGRPAAEVVTRLRSEGVLANAEGSHPNWVRFVCHLDLSAEDISEATSRIERGLRA